MNANRIAACLTSYHVAEACAAYMDEAFAAHNEALEIFGDAISDSRENPFSPAARAAVVSARAASAVASHRASEAIEAHAWAARVAMAY